MDGREVRQRAQTAQEMTDEINRVTDASVGFGVENGDFGTENGAREAARNEGGGGVSQAQARGIGGLAMGQVLTYNPDAAYLSARERAENERVYEMAEADNGYARNEIVPNLSSVMGEATGNLSRGGAAGNLLGGEVEGPIRGETAEGSVMGESAIEEAGRLADDRENLLSELDPERSFGAKVQAKSQEEIAKGVSAEMGKLLRKKSFSPNEVENYRFAGMEAMMQAFAQPRIFKERNG